MCVQWSVLKKIYTHIIGKAVVWQVDVCTIQKEKEPCKQIDALVGEKLVALLVGYFTDRPNMTSK